MEQIARLSLSNQEESRKPAKPLLPPLSARALVSVVIPNWNGARFLPACLDSLARQTYTPVEIIIADNGSTDESLPLLHEHYPQARVIELSTNRGFAAGVNAGIAAARGEVIALLNNDVEVDAHWVDVLVNGFRDYPEVGICASKMLFYTRRQVINSAGDHYTLAGIPGNRGANEEDRGQYDRPEKIFGACGGAAAYRRDLLERIGLFDEDFVSYCEDVDLNFRAQLQGYECLYLPGAVVYHYGSATGGGPLASYYCGRNFLAVLAKNMPAALLRRHWRRILGAQLAITRDALLAIRGEAARARLRGQIAGILALPRFLKKRIPIQAGSRIGLDEIEALLVDQG